MSTIAISWIIFACVFGGAMLGMLLRSVVPAHHLSADSKDIVKLGMGLIATMSALVLALLIASAKTSHDTQNGEVIQIAAGFIQLDRVLAHYGPETRDIRYLLRGLLARGIGPAEGRSNYRPANLDSPKIKVGADSFSEKTQKRGRTRCGGVVRRFSAPGLTTTPVVSSPVCDGGANDG